MFGDKLFTLEERWKSLDFIKIYSFYVNLYHPPESNKDQQRGFEAPKNSIKYLYVSSWSLYRLPNNLFALSDPQMETEGKVSDIIGRPSHSLIW